MLKSVIISGKSCLLTAYGNTTSLTCASEVDPTRCYVAAESPDAIVVAAALSRDSTYLYCAYENKTASCFDVSSGELLGTCKTNKKPTQVAVALTRKSETDVSEVLLISDKGGEVWATDLPRMRKQVRLFGHTASVVTDMIINSYGNIVTADRDEKIRVTKFPATYSIEGYMLHHTDVVTSLSTLGPQSDNIMISSGWDHRICVWNSCTQQLLDSIEPTASTRHTSDNPTGSTSTIINSTSPETAMVEESENTTSAGEEGDELEDNRLYDVSQAGAFPMRIRSSTARVRLSHNTSASLSVAVVLSYGANDVKFIGVDPTTGRIVRSRGGSDPLGSLPDIGSITLSAPPVDCTFSHDDSALYVLLPAPHYMAVYAISYGQADNGDGQVVPNVTAERISIDNAHGNTYALTASAFVAFATSQGVSASQKLSFAEDTAEGAEGIRKHELERRFDKVAHTTAARNSKQSKRQKRIKHYAE